jgi:FkbM family methyltransferase
VIDLATDVAIDRLPLADNEKRRIRIALSCADAETIPKVPGAGETFDHDGGVYQLMHNGVRVEADGYYGRWMTALIRLMHGHHEPQEERVFHELLPHLAATGRPVTMCELGSYWSYYSLWAGQAIPGTVNILAEPDPNHLAVGVRNYALNNASAHCYQVQSGRVSAPPSPFTCESDGVTRDVATMCVDDIVADRGLERLDLLLADIQGAELPMLQGAERTIASGRLRFVFVSTHHHSISGDPLTHQRCLELVRGYGGHVIAEHNVTESFSGDGLIVASFDPADRAIAPIPITRNHPTNSLFRELEYDLAAMRIELQHATELNRTLRAQLDAPTRA